jgi:hypothetical protein
MAETLTNPDVIHDDVHETSRKGGWDYYRMNASDDEKLSVPLDEWCPRGIFARNSGSQTLATIQANYQAWFSDPRNQRDVRSCAEALVIRRRARTGDPAKWERFATGAEFICNQEGCPKLASPFSDRDAFRRHLLDTHFNLEESDVNESLMNDCMKQWRYRQKAT